MGRRSPRKPPSRPAAPLATLTTAEFEAAMAGYRQAIESWSKRFKPMDDALRDAERIKAEDLSVRVHCDTNLNARFPVTRTVVAKVKDRLLHDPIQLNSNDSPVPAPPDRVNVYTCEKCGGYTVTIDIHQGVTPFMLRCRASGREGDCDGRAESAFYPKGPRPPHIPPPAWEWFKPVGSEYRKLSREMKEHVDKGGLDIRKIRQ